MVKQTRRPKDIRTLHVFRTGTSNNDLDVLEDDQTTHAYFLDRAAGTSNAQYERAWNYKLYRGTAPFDVSSSPIYRIHRNQADASIEFYRNDGHLQFTMDWAGKGKIGGITAAPMQHYFYWNGRKYEWDEHSHLTGKDYYCKDTSTGETIAYFRAVMTPQTKEGKLEISHQVQPGDLEDALVATCIAYREWCIRRTLLIFGDPWFNQSVTG